MFILNSNFNPASYRVEDYYIDNYLLICTLVSRDNSFNILHIITTDDELSIREKHQDSEIIYKSKDFLEVKNTYYMLRKYLEDYEEK